jgi:hypothetical protein
LKIILVARERESASRLTLYNISIRYEWKWSCKMTTLTA